jgi:DNA-directed RNA polymerase sigma subunit (sigma70/sigma32)
MTESYIINRVELVKRYEEVKGKLKLKPRTLEIFEFRNGFIDGKTHTLSETGKRFGISGERTRAHEAHVLYEIERSI